MNKTNANYSNTRINTKRLQDIKNIIRANNNTTVTIASSFSMASIKIIIVHIIIIVMHGYRAYFFMVVSLQQRYPIEFLCL